MLRFFLRMMALMMLMCIGFVALIKPVGGWRHYEPLVYTTPNVALIYTTPDEGVGYGLRLHDLVTRRDIVLFGGDNLRIADVSPNGDLIYTATKDGVPYMAVRNAHTLHTHFIIEDFDRPAVWSPDGTRLAYVQQNDEAYILHIRHLYDPIETAQFLPVLVSPVNLAWMADGERLTYWEATTPTNYALSVIDVATGETEVLYNWHARTQNTAWLPDGRYGLLSTVHNNYRFDLSTRQIEQLNTEQYDRNSLHIAQDGARILYTSLTFNGRMIYLANPTGDIIQSVQLDAVDLAVSVGWWQVD